MPIPTETLTRILLEIVNGAPPVRRDTDEEAQIRRQLEDDVVAIRRRGGIVEIPPEMP